MYMHYKTFRHLIHIHTWLYECLYIKMSVQLPLILKKVSTNTTCKMFHKKKKVLNNRCTVQNEGKGSCDSVWL